MSGLEMAQAIVNALPAIIKVIERRFPPPLFTESAEVGRSGRFESFIAAIMWLRE